MTLGWPLTDREQRLLEVPIIGSRRTELLLLCVTGLIEDRPTCAALVARIMNEAEETLKRLQMGA